MTAEARIESDPSKRKPIVEYFKAIRKRQDIEAERYGEEYFDNLDCSAGNLRKRKESIIDCAGKLYDLRKTSYKTVEKHSEKERLPIFFNDLEFSNLREANYDLRLGGDVYVTTEGLPKKLNQIGADATISIEPGEFGILMTYEYIAVPQDLMGLISIRFRYKEMGLVNISGFHVNPGFCGRILFAVYNAGPSKVVLRYKEPVFMIMFDKLKSPVREIKESIFRKMDNIPVRIISTLGGPSVSVRGLDERVRRIETIFPVLITILVGLLIAMLTWVLTHW